MDLKVGGEASAQGQKVGGGDLRSGSESVCIGGRQASEQDKKVGLQAPGKDRKVGLKISKLISKKKRKKRKRVFSYACFFLLLYSMLKIQLFLNCWPKKWGGGIMNLPTTFQSGGMHHSKKSLHWLPQLIYCFCIEYRYWWTSRTKYHWNIYCSLDI